MTIFEMLEQSGILTLLGMGVLFSFLIIMVFIISMFGKINSVQGLDKDTAALAKVNISGKVNDTKAGSPASATAGAGTTPQIAAAITAAIIDYQKGNK